MPPAINDEIDVDDPSSSSSTVIPKLLEYIFRSSKCSKSADVDLLQWRISIGFRRFVAMTSIVSPNSISKDIPAWKLAEALGITSSQFSKLCGEISKDLGGLKSPTMRSDRHRAACSRARSGVKSMVAGKRKLTSNIAKVGQQRYRDAEHHGIQAALVRFQAGKPWSKMHTRLLTRAGLIDDNGTLTAAGVAHLQSVASNDAPRQGISSVSKMVVGVSSLGQNERLSSK